MHTPTQSQGAVTIFVTSTHNVILCKCKLYSYYILCLLSSSVMKTAEIEFPKIIGASSLKISTINISSPSTTLSSMIVMFTHWIMSPMANISSLLGRLKSASVNKTSYDIRYTATKLNVTVLAIFHNLISAVFTLRFIIRVHKLNVIKKLNCMLAGMQWINFYTNTSVQ